MTAYQWRDRAHVPPAAMTRAELVAALARARSQIAWLEHRLAHPHGPTPADPLADVHRAELRDALDSIAAAHRRQRRQSLRSAS